MEIRRKKARKVDTYDIVKENMGLKFIMGTTASGMSTSLYSQFSNENNGRVITIEEPMEIKLDENTKMNNFLKNIKTQHSKKMYIGR